MTPKLQKLISSLITRHSLISKVRYDKFWQTTSVPQIYHEFRIRPWLELWDHPDHQVNEPNSRTCFAYYTALYGEKGALTVVIAKDMSQVWARPIHNQTTRNKDSWSASICDLIAKIPPKELYDLFVERMEFY